MTLDFEIIYQDGMCIISKRLTDKGTQYKIELTRTLGEVSG